MTVLGLDAYNYSSEASLYSKSFGSSGQRLQRYIADIHKGILIILVSGMHLCADYATGRLPQPSLQPSYYRMAVTGIARHVMVHVDTIQDSPLMGLRRLRSNQSLPWSLLHGIDCSFLDKGCP